MSSLELMRDVAFTFMELESGWDSLATVSIEMAISTAFCTSYYLLQSFLGEGCFGQVAQCLKLPTKETVAVKILKTKSKYAVEAEKELAMLKVVSSLDPDTHNIVRFHEGFFYRGLTCLVFEQLHMSLLDYMRQTHFRPLSLNEIRPITVQLATAFKALKSIGLIHTDLKLDNIMLVDQVNQPFRVKLIDFGLAVRSSEVQRGSILQPIGYRAPEVVLGLPISEAIDMWSLGCVMAAMFLGRNLYPSWKEFDMLPWEYFRDTGKSPRCPSRFRLGSLDVLLECRPEGADEHEEEDIRAFVDLLKRMLNLDAAKRITPSQALRHRFLSMTHLAMGYHHSS
ncbi:homeodomain-interacting protein kinase 1-like [Lampris incognitus]|uniref:homeodomain-interacting protein kinase 1-like n=1 Tax=Lampris incognitus TaxID=2546036 RepID=UPI0024B52C48|nr:homeodomain-interacting protein kinase 1-like [Lampris incognitus]